MNKKTSLIALTSLTATAVATSAAFFSVTGISKLFAGASFAALIMASTLEFGKIVGISFLYQYWKEIPGILKTYLTVAATVLMLITSVGIYGFLSAAYQTTADELAIMDQQAAVTQLRIDRYQEELDLYVQERERISSTIEQLSSGLANNTIQYVDQETGQLITTTSSATRNALQEQLRGASEERSNIATRIEAATDSITSLETQLLEAQMNNEVAAEVGPLRFVSNLTGWQMDQVVNIFALMIVFVFDPLAVALVISVNFLLKYKEDEEEEPTFLVKEKGSVEDLPKEVNTEVPVTKDEENYYADFTPKEEETKKEPTEEPYKVYAPESGSVEVDTGESKMVINNAKVVQPDVKVQTVIKDGKKEITEIPVEPKNTSPTVDEALILRKYMDLNRNGIPEWMEHDFDWNNTKLWTNNPFARLYKKNVVDKRR